MSQWDRDLEAQAKEFQRLAGEVEVWDRVLNDNAKQVSKRSLVTKERHVRLTDPAYVSIDFKCLRHGTPS